MANIINTIISNDLLFYGIIIFLIVGVIVLFMYLHHKKVINLLEEEIEFTKVEDDKINNSLQNFAEELKLNETKSEIDDKINELDGKLAMEKILNEDVTVQEKMEKIENDHIIKEASKVKSDSKEEKITKVESSENNSKESKSELELMLERMQHDLEEQKEQDAVAIFEHEQEEKSIISYKELLDKKNELLKTDAFNDVRFENEPAIINETSSYEELPNNKTLSETVITKTEQINDNMSVAAVKDENSKKFKTTDFISPVFGRREANFDYPKVPNFKEMLLRKENTNDYDLEATLNLDSSAGVKKDEAFLSALKEFRKNLE